MHATGVRHRALKDPVGQRRCRDRLAGIDVLLDPLGDLQPAGLLPEFKRTLLGAKAPAHRKVDIARGFGDARQMHGGVVKLVTQHRPEKTRLGAFSFAQQFEALASGLFQHPADHLIGFRAAAHVIHAFRVQPQDFTTDFFIKSGTSFLPQAFRFQQFGQHRRRAVQRIKRVFKLAVGGATDRAQLVLQRLDDVGHGVQADHVRGAESARTGAAQFLAGQVVDHVIAQAKIFSFRDGGQHAGNADTVGDKVGRVMRANHAFAQAAGDKGFQIVEHAGPGGRRVDQLDQRHVTRRVEKMNAAKPRLDGRGQGVAQLRDRQTRGVACNDGAFRYERRDLVVQRGLPVHAFGNRLDDQVAFLEQVQVLFVIGRLNQRRVFGHAKRCRLEFFKPLDGPRDDAIFRADVTTWQVKQHHRHFEVDQMGGDLRAHDAGAENSDFFNLKAGHLFLFLVNWLLVLFHHASQFQPDARGSHSLEPAVRSHRCGPCKSGATTRSALQAGCASLNPYPGLGAAKRPESHAHFEPVAALDRMQTQGVGPAIFGVQNFALAPPIRVFHFLDIADDFHSELGLVLAVIRAFGTDRSRVDHQTFLNHPGQQAPAVGTDADLGFCLTSLVVNRAPQTHRRVLRHCRQTGHY